MSNFDNKLYNDVIKLREQGWTIKQIADKLEVPTRTVELIIIREYY